jgi:hypothetical protein
MQVLEHFEKVLHLKLEKKLGIKTFGAKNFKE